MSSYWCHWCTLSAKEWSNKSHAKGLLWTGSLLKEASNDKIINKDILS